MPLPLPRNLSISRDLEAEKTLHAKARAYLERGGQNRAGIHATDLMNPRLTAWKTLSGDGLPDRLVNMFVVGQLAHAIIEVIHAGEGSYLTKSQDSGTKLYKELRYSPDILELNGEPIEIKTTRSFYEPKKAYLPDDDTFHAYLEQLLIYMAAEDKTQGRLMLLYLNMKGSDGRTAPQFYIWTIETSAQALAAYRTVMEGRMKDLQKALNERNPNTLPLCRAFLCRDCQYWEKCKPEGRYGRKEKDWVI